MYQTSYNHKILSVVVIYLEADTGQIIFLLTGGLLAPMYDYIVNTACVLYSLNLVTNL